MRQMGWISFWRDHDQISLQGLKVPVYEGWRVRNGELLIDDRVAAWYRKPTWIVAVPGDEGVQTHAFTQWRFDLTY